MDFQIKITPFTGDFCTKLRIFWELPRSQFFVMNILPYLSNWPVFVFPYCYQILIPFSWLVQMCMVLQDEFNYAMFKCIKETLCPKIWHWIQQVFIWQEKVVKIGFIINNILKAFTQNCLLQVPFIYSLFVPKCIILKNFLLTLAERLLTMMTCVKH